MQDNQNFTNAGQRNGRVEFHEEEGSESWRAVGFYRTKNPPFFVRLLIQHSEGKIQNERQATKVLIVISILCIILSGAIYFALTRGTLILQSSEPKENSLCQEKVSPELKTLLSADDYRKIPPCKK